MAKHSWKRVGAVVFAASTFGSLSAQTPPEPVPTATPLAFAVASVKPAPPGAYWVVPAFMRDKTKRILGLQKMAAPVFMLAGYAYQMQISEAADAFRKQPEWTRKKVYTVNVRVEGEPNRNQMREMMRTMLADRFGLQVHEFTREGMVNKLVLNKPGVLGPNLKPHLAGASCSTQESSSADDAPDTPKPPVKQCGIVFSYLPESVVRVQMTDISILGAGRTLAGIGANGLETHPIVDATGLTGQYDLTLEYRPATIGGLPDPDAEDSGTPSLVRALKEQLGIRVESGEGPVRMIVIDHLSEPTPD